MNSKLITHYSLLITHYSLLKFKGGERLTPIAFSPPGLIYHYSWDNLYPISPINNRFPLHILAAFP